MKQHATNPKSIYPFEVTMEFIKLLNVEQKYPKRKYKVLWDNTTLKWYNCLIVGKTSLSYSMYVAKLNLH